MVNIYWCFEKYNDSGLFVIAKTRGQAKRIFAEELADHLLDNGIVVPPCKVGDTVWYLNKHPHIALIQNSVYKAEVVRLVTISTGTVIVIQIKSEGCCEIPDESDWGITLFATREQAQAKLKEGGQE